MQMVVAGGGTGGHLFPGLAVADALTARHAAEVRFVGSDIGIEARIIPTTRYPFTPLSIRGLRGRGLRGIFQFGSHLPRAVYSAWRLLGGMRPNLVLGLGGYGSTPVVVAAWLRHVPTILLEQNARPGLANRSLAHLAARVCTTFAESERYFPRGKAIHTGNPVRQLSTRREPQSGYFTVLAFGGSQGSRSINRAMVEAAALLKADLPGLQIIHQTGAADVEWVEKKYQEAGVHADVKAFIHDMGEAYGSANVVLCRAGATTIAELTALGKPAILVPYPYAADDHQRANAEVLVQHGAAHMILDAELSGATLAKHLRMLSQHGEILAAMAIAAKQLAIPDAAQRVLAVCGEVVGEAQ